MWSAAKTLASWASGRRQRAGEPCPAQVRNLRTSAVLRGPSFTCAPSGLTAPGSRGRPHVPGGRRPSRRGPGRTRCARHARRSRRPLRRSPHCARADPRPQGSCPSPWNRWRVRPSITRTVCTMSAATALSSRVAPTCALRPSLLSVTAASNWSSIWTNCSSTHSTRRARARRDQRRSRGRATGPEPGAGDPTGGPWPEAYWRRRGGLRGGRTARHDSLWSAWTKPNAALKAEHGSVVGRPPCSRVLGHVVERTNPVLYCASCIPWSAA
jgi:hypothetical protein